MDAVTARNTLTTLRKAKVPPLLEAGATIDGESRRVYGNERSTTPVNDGVRTGSPTGAKQGWINPNTQVATVPPVAPANPVNEGLRNAVNQQSARDTLAARDRLGNMQVEQMNATTAAPKPGPLTVREALKGNKVQGAGVGLGLATGVMSAADAVQNGVNTGNAAGMVGGVASAVEGGTMLGRIPAAAAAPAAVVGAGATGVMVGDKLNRQANAGQQDLSVVGTKLGGLWNAVHNTGASIGRGAAYALADPDMRHNMRAVDDDELEAKAQAGDLRGGTGLFKNALYAAPSPAQPAGATPAAAESKTVAVTPTAAPAAAPVVDKFATTPTQAMPTQAAQAPTKARTLADQYANTERELIYGDSAGGDGDKAIASLVVGNMVGKKGRAMADAASKQEAEQGANARHGLSAALDKMKLDTLSFNSDRDYDLNKRKLEASTAAASATKAHELEKERIADTDAVLEKSGYSGDQQTKYRDFARQFFSNGQVVDGKKMKGVENMSPAELRNYEPHLKAAFERRADLNANSLPAWVGGASPTTGRAVEKTTLRDMNLGDLPKNGFGIPQIYSSDSSSPSIFGRHGLVDGMIYNATGGLVGADPTILEERDAEGNVVTKSLRRALKRSYANEGSLDERARRTAGQ